MSETDTETTGPTAEVQTGTTTALAPCATDGVLVRRRTRLHDLRALRRYLSKVGRDLEAEPLDTLKPTERVQLARAKTYLAQTMSELIRADSLEARLEELERVILARGF